MDSLTSLDSARVVVMGLGQFDGGVGVARFLVSQGADVLVTDLRDETKLSSSLAKLAGLPIEYRLGEHNVSDFTTADLIVVNPAVPVHNNRFLRAAGAADIPMTTEMRLLVERLPNPQHVIGITGSAGKSTCTSMVGFALQELGHTVHVGGNLGGSLLGKVDQIGADDWVVLELSSFMLHWLDLAHWSPHIAVVTSYAPNHLDWHADEADYIRCKQVILDHQDAAADHAILGPGLAETFKPVAHPVVREKRDSELVPDGRLLLPGEHNRLNALLAADVVEKAVGASRDEVLEKLATFGGLPHRLQLVAERCDVRYFNDSKSTTPDAAILAMKCFPRGKVHLILGGYDKKSDMTQLAKQATDWCHTVYTIGDTGDAIADLIDQNRQAQADEYQTLDRSMVCGGAAGWEDATADVLRSGTLENAIKQTVDRIRRGDVVLLSPGCASWDQFENYEARGRAFVELVLNYTGEGARPPGAG